jgi:hypothetical protein
MSKQNEPAFPVVFTDQVYGKDGESSTDTYSAGGMTLRDWFAGQALAGLIGHPTTFGCTGDSTIAEMAYKLADAMLLERAK